MSVQTGTGTTAEMRTLYNAVLKIEPMLRAYDDGTGTGGAGGKSGRFTPAEIDTQIAAVSAAIAAVNS